jgi:hypothetical protein
MVEKEAERRVARARKYVAVFAGEPVSIHRISANTVL